MKKCIGILLAAMMLLALPVLAVAETPEEEVSQREKVTFSQAIRDNPEVDVSIVISFGAIIALCLFLQKQKIYRIIEEERKASSYIVRLATNYECVDYIDIRENKLEDTIKEHHVVSEKIGSLIPAWKNENHLSRRISLLMNELVIPEDRVYFWQNTRREAIFKSFDEDQVHQVSFRVLMQGKILYYQERFTPVRDEKGKIVGMISGIMDAGESKIAEPF